MELPACMPTPTHLQEAGLKQQGFPIQKGCPGFGGGDFFRPVATNPHPPHTFTCTHCVQSLFGQLGLQTPPPFPSAGREAA